MYRANRAYIERACARHSSHNGALYDAKGHLEGQFQCHLQEDPGAAYWEGGKLWTPIDQSMIRNQSIPQIYIDTSLILEALEHYFPSSAGYGTLYPAGHATTYRPLIRGFASYWTDRPFFRATCGLIPSSVWRTHFGVDRADLIGHKLDADKLERKVPQNLSGVDMHFSLLEPLLADPEKKWLFEGQKPSAADLALWYQLDWGEKIARGEGVADLTAGGAEEGVGESMDSVFNNERYPGLWAWFHRFRKYIADLASTEARIERTDEASINKVLQKIKETRLAEEIPLLPTPAGPYPELDKRNGLAVGAEISIAPDDTGRDSPTVGRLLAITPEEVVIEPKKIGGAGSAVGEVRVHFPRVAFVIRPVGQAKL